MRVEKPRFSYPFNLESLSLFFCDNAKLAIWVSKNGREYRSLRNGGDGWASRKNPPEPDRTWCICETGEPLTNLLRYAEGRGYERIVVLTQPNQTDAPSLHALLGRATWNQLN